MTGQEIDSVPWLLGFTYSATTEHGSFISVSLQLFLQEPKSRTKIIERTLSKKPNNYFKKNLREKKLGESTETLPWKIYTQNKKD